MIWCFAYSHSRDSLRSFWDPRWKVEDQCFYLLLSTDIRVRCILLSPIIFLLWFLSGEKVYNVITRITDAILAVEAKLNELDNLVGDGDCGSTLARGAKGLKYEHTK